MSIIDDSTVFCQILPPREGRILFSLLGGDLLHLLPGQPPGGTKASSLDLSQRRG